MIHFDTIRLRFKQSLIPLLLLLSTTVSVVPLGTKSLFYGFPTLDIMLIYFFTIYGRQWLSPVIVTFAGIYHDALFAQPLGMTAIGYLIFFVMVLSQRWIFSRQDMLIAWGGFAIMSGVYFFFSWGFISALEVELFPFTATLLTWLVTATCYGIVHWLCQCLLGYIELSGHAQST